MQRLGQERIDQTDERRIVGVVEQVFDLRDILQQALQIHILCKIAGQGGRLLVGTAVYFYQ